MEGTRLVTIPIVLKGVNYLLWSRMVKTTLSGRGLWSHVIQHEAPRRTVMQDDGSELIIGSDEEKWNQEDQLVLSIIQSSLESSILEAYSYCDTAKELWDILRKVYGNLSNLSRVFELKRELNTLNQEGLEFTAHFGKFRSLWAELEVLRPSSTDPEVLMERREQDKVFGLMLTLHSAYNDLIKHILRSDKLPTLEEVCAQIQKEQGSLGLFGDKGELITANKSFLKPEERRNLFCSHCKKEGHLKEACWVLHPHLKPPRFRRANVSKAPSTSIPQERGKWREREQPESSRGQALVTTHGASIQDEMVRRSDLDALIKALKENSGNVIHVGNVLGRSYNASYIASKPSKLLIVDSGASHHMISDPSLISNVEPALGNVIIANGEQIPIKGIGNLRLFDKESKAFYMPSFTSNLLSVKKATTDLNCRVIFSPDDVHFQDIESSRLLGK